jgi:hypothetical protein
MVVSDKTFGVVSSVSNVIVGGVWGYFPPEIFCIFPPRIAFRVFSETDCLDILYCVALYCR